MPKLPFTSVERLSVSGILPQWKGNNIMFTFLDECARNAHRLAIWEHLRRTLVTLLDQPAATRELSSDRLAVQDARVSDTALMDVLLTVHDLEKRETEMLKGWRRVCVDDSEGGARPAQKPRLASVTDLSDCAEGSTPAKHNSGARARSK